MGEFNFILIYCDGASRGNPGPGGWGAIIGFPEGIVQELGGYDAHTTNNRMELMGAIQSLAKLQGISGAVRVYTDSSYVIKGITQWIWGWRAKGWKTADGKSVLNEDLWQSLFSLVMKRGKENKVEWRYVKGHAGYEGNERVDVIATSMADHRSARLYHGPLLKYSFNLWDLPPDREVPVRKIESATEKKQAFAYLSYIDSKAMRHATWRECELRVKGRSGAKFKKVLSEEELHAVLKSWGVSL